MSGLQLSKNKIKYLNKIYIAITIKIGYFISGFLSEYIYIEEAVFFISFVYTCLCIIAFNVKLFFLINSWYKCILVILRECAQECTSVTLTIVFFKHNSNI